MMCRFRSCDAKLPSLRWRCNYFPVFVQFVDRDLSSLTRSMYPLTKIGRIQLFRGFRRFACSSVRICICSCTHRRPCTCLWSAPLTYTPVTLLFVLMPDMHREYLSVGLGSILCQCLQLYLRITIVNITSRILVKVFWSQANYPGLRLTCCKILEKTVFSMIPSQHGAAGANLCLELNLPIFWEKPADFPAWLAWSFYHCSIHQN